VTLEKVILTVAVNRICIDAFRGCAALQRIDLSGMTANAEIEIDAFRESGIVEIELPLRMRSINSDAFRACKQLQSVKLPRELGTLYFALFTECTALRTLIVGEIKN
jgi:hypothetical protein